VDLTDGVLGAVRSTQVKDGSANVFVLGSTAAVTLMEFEPGGVQDLTVVLDQLIPREGDYEHNRLNSDTHAHAHIRAAIVGPSEAIPIVEGKLMTGTWQQVVLIDFDDRARDRTVVVQIVS